MWTGINLCTNALCCWWRLVVFEICSMSIMPKKLTEY